MGWVGACVGGIERGEGRGGEGRIGCREVGEGRERMKQEREIRCREGERVENRGKADDYRTCKN
jgi:hypothetical protein